MKLLIKNAAKIMMFLLATIIITSSITSCKSKKKLAREKAAAEYASKVDQAKNDLTAMLNGTTTWTLDEQDSRLNVIKSYNIDDPDVVELISKVEAKISMDKAEAERLAEEERLRQIEVEKKKAMESKYLTIDDQLRDIANAQDVSIANTKIDVVLQQFATTDIPVLIVISNAGGYNDYDRPTTISRFLNYLKDKQSYQYKVEEVKRDALGKITELELIKK